ncbi:MAG: AAA family ATPase [Candidatus Marinimicrobia bacterium]|nr:AAA family ATPase [Candidatus Neomarinimicrobiota bacterium]|tara:strand:- start:2972 stop:4273 length:1302 start_codon:yes stop_codon:yes gene_type:complete
MTKTSSLFNKHLPPLADRVRPNTISDFIGQNHLIDSKRIINEMVTKNKYYSMILWGPPGCGKTTLARIIAKSSESIIYEISAISSGVKDLRNIFVKSQANNDNGISSIIFIDEIHRFSKSQQDALLHAVEEGLIILIGATTENPSFEIINPLLSRCKTLKLKPLDNDALHTILHQSIKSDILLSQKNIVLNKKIQKKLVRYSSGDARKMLNTFEIALNMSDDNNLITETILDEALQSNTQLYDKNSDFHYDTISAYIKSIRGSDPDAAIYWMAVMLEGGEKPEFILRRLIILASEDIGNADPQAIQLAVAGFQATKIIGMPESAIILSQITVYLASAPKSNASYVAINRAQEKVRKNGTPAIPLHLRNATTNLMKEEKYGKDYKYPHNYSDKFVKENYFPNGVQELFYQPTTSGYENYIRERLIKNWPERYNT